MNETQIKRHKEKKRLYRIMHRESEREQRRLWEERNREKHLAHKAIENGIRRGKIEKPNSCSECGEIGYVHGHHEDYHKPLDVIWLCPDCHRDRHNK